MTMGLFRAYLLEKGICQWLLLWVEYDCLPHPQQLLTAYTSTGRRRASWAPPPFMVMMEFWRGGVVVLFSSYPWSQGMHCGLCYCGNMHWWLACSTEVYNLQKVLPKRIYMNHSAWERCRVRNALIVTRFIWEMYLGLLSWNLST